MEEPSQRKRRVDVRKVQGMRVLSGPRQESEMSGGRKRPGRLAAFCWGLFVSERERVPGGEERRNRRGGRMGKERAGEGVIRRLTIKISRFVASVGERFNVSCAKVTMK